jgi:pyruvate-formate lyase-activating enzyme
MRIVVGMRCEVPCTSCTVCDGSTVGPAVDDVLRALGDAADVTLGGGDASCWPGLAPLLAARVRRAVKVEAPLTALQGSNTASRLVRLGVAEAIVLIDVTRLQSERVHDEQVVARVAEIERQGLAVSPRLCARPVAFERLAALAAALAPRASRVELVRQDVGGRPIPMSPALVSRILRAPGLVFAGDRRRDAGYLPPCALPELHAARPEVWSEVLSSRSGRNTALSECADCPQAERCSFSDIGALGAELRRGSGAKTTLPRRPARRAVLCMEPWLKMELTDPDALVHQCCSDWTVGPRGDRRVSTLREIWNGPGYRAARRLMLRGPITDLCRPVCPRLHDRANEASRFSVIPGSPGFVRNQELMLEDIAEGREELRSMPLNIGLCPSTYCNFDCIMCGYGRTPRRDIPEEVWDELPYFLPTLSTLVLLGGEPLANPRTMTFLRAFDSARWPDTGISVTTNGSLLTRATLRHLASCPFASILVSVNAGTAETYEAVQRGTPFQTLLENLDALVEFRAAHNRPFDLRTGFVVQPANAHTLIAFGELTAARGLGIRLLPLHSNPSHSLDYYGDPDEVARVLESLDGFAAWAAARQPGWLVEIRAIRSAILAETARLGIAGIEGERARLPLLRT